MAKYKIWDKVRIRKWEDMEKKFWLNEDWDIQIYLNDNKEQEKECFIKELDTQNKDESKLAEKLEYENAVLKDILQKT